MKKSVALILFFLLGNSLGLMAQDLNSTIQIQARKMVDALVNGNFNYMVSKTHPDIVSVIGGKEKMLGVLQKQMDVFLKQEVSFESIEIGQPSEIFQATDELHCLIPQKIVMKISGGTITTNGYLLGISQDQGQNWYFLDTAQLNNENVERMIPNYNQKLRIPDKVQPEFVKD